MEEKPKRKNIIKRRPKVSSKTEPALNFISGKNQFCRFCGEEMSGFNEIWNHFKEKHLESFLLNQSSDKVRLWIHFKLILNHFKIF